MMDSSSEDDPGLLDAVKDSLRRQVVELQRRILDQRERNLTTDLMLRDAYDQAKTKHILKALQLKKQLKDAEAAASEERKVLGCEVAVVESLIETLSKRKIESMRWRIRELTKVQRLFAPTPLVFRNLVARSRYQSRPSPPLEESTSQDPDTPFISPEEDQTYEQIPTTPESLPKPTDKAESLLMEVEMKVAGLYKAIATWTDGMKRKLAEGGASFEDEEDEQSRQGTSISDQKSCQSHPIPDPNPRDSPIALFEIDSQGTRSIAEPAEGDDEVTFRWSPGESVLGLVTQEVAEGDTEDENRLAVLNSSLLGEHGRQVRGTFVREGLANAGDQSSPSMTMENISCDQLLQSEEAHTPALPSTTDAVSPAPQRRQRPWRCLFCPCLGRR